MVLDTADDRTLFFDLMPVFFKTKSGFTIKIKLYTVPGQVMHNSTRRIVLQGVDGIAFIADSQKTQTKANNDSWRDMTQNLRANGLDITKLPVVIQFNKRDLPNVRSEEEIEAVTRRGKEPVFMASAIQGVGVFETLDGLLRLAWRSLDATMQLEQRLHLCEDEFVANVLRRPKPTSQGAS
jgi:Predicted GTPase